MNVTYSKKMCKDKKTLDIGCSGYSNKFSIHNQLKELNLPLLVGIDNQNITDISNNLIQCDIQKFSDVTALLQKFGPFERIVMLEVIEHIGNVYDTVINLSRLLKTNGIIVISTPNAISDKWLKQVRQYGYHKGGKRHIHWYDKQTIEQLFNIFGFELYEIISKDLEPRLIVSFKKVEEINIWEYKTK